MISSLIFIILSTFLVSLLSFAGLFTLSLKENILNKFIFSFVSLSIGALIGDAFLHLLPEATEKINNESVYLFVIIGFFMFFIIEKVIHWRHCHQEHCSVHTFAHMNLIGDGIHNFIDGLIIAGSYIVNPGVGAASTIAVFLHEIPQEIGDFGVLIYGGMSRKKALFYNFFSAVTAVFGGIFGFYLLSFSNAISGFLLAIAAGGFLYIAASDLLPEVRKENNTKKIIINFTIIILGVLIMYLLKLIDN